MKQSTFSGTLYVKSDIKQSKIENAEDSIGSSPFPISTREQTNERTAAKELAEYCSSEIP